MKAEGPQSAECEGANFVNNDNVITIETRSRLFSGTWFHLFMFLLYYSGLPNSLGERPRLWPHQVQLRGGVLPEPRQNHHQYLRHSWQTFHIFVGTSKKESKLRLLALLVLSHGNHGRGMSYPYHVRVVLESQACPAAGEL